MYAVPGTPSPELPYAVPGTPGTPVPGTPPGLPELPVPGTPRFTTLPPPRRCLRLRLAPPAPRRPVHGSPGGLRIERPAGVRRHAALHTHIRREEAGTRQTCFWASSPLCRAAIASPTSVEEPNAGSPAPPRRGACTCPRCGVGGSRCNTAASRRQFLGTFRPRALSGKEDSLQLVVVNNPVEVALNRCRNARAGVAVDHGSNSPPGRLTPARRNNVPPSVPALNAAFQRDPSLDSHRRYKYGLRPRDKRAPPTILAA